MTLIVQRLQNVVKCRSDGIDDDADGRIDCEDSECLYTVSCFDIDCTDGIDNEGDGLADCNDQIVQAPNCSEAYRGDKPDNDDDGS